MIVQGDNPGSKNLFIKSTMRPLTEEETKTLFEKLSKYIGRNISYLVDQPEDPHVFRMHRDRVFYIRESIARKAENFARDSIISVGVCFGKFTKGGNFRLHITAVEYVSQFAQYKVWIKPTAEMSFLYGNHVLKAHIQKMTEGVPEHQGIAVFSAKDLPLGFAVTAKSSVAVANLQSTAIACFHQADVGEYLRDEETII